MNGRYPNRNGLSLTEVLIATFVMAIGLLSLASLIPVGLHEVAAANRSQRAAALGRSAWREIKVRNWLQPYGPPWPAGPALANQALWVNRQGNPVGLPSSWPNGAMPTPRFSAFAIDPHFLAAYSNNADSASFPINDANGSPLMRRITLRAHRMANALGAIPPGAAITAQNNQYLYARRLFTDQDEPVFETIEDAPRPDRVGLISGYPEVQGHFSWMITVSPSVSDTNRLSIVSVVVFYKRQVENPTGGAPLPDPTQERTAQVVFPGPGPHIGGGDVRLNWNGGADAFPNLRPGKWLMLFGQIQNNGPIFARWYKIVATDDYEADGFGSTNNQRYVTLQGYDWPNQQMIPQTYAGVFDGVVGVYEKTMQLE